MNEKQARIPALNDEQQRNSLYDEVQQLWAQREAHPDHEEIW